MCVGIAARRHRPDETVIYTAHWDHLGIGQPDANGDRIYNGAIDNGTGIAQLIEQARAFAHGPRPQRSVVFMAVTAEEKGLLGSEYYATNPIYPLGKTAGMINTDVMGVLGPARDFTVRGNQKFGLLDMLVDEAAKRGRRYTPDPASGNRRLLSLRPFHARQGRRPGNELRPGQDLVNGGVPRAEAWSKNYTAKMYHQPADEYSPTGTSPAWRRMRSCCTASDCGWPIRATGRIGATTANSAPPATPARPSVASSAAEEMANAVEASPLKME